MAQPIWRSISTIFSTLEVSSRVDVTRFSTPRITPSPVATYILYMSTLNTPERTFIKEDVEVPLSLWIRA